MSSFTNDINGAHADLNGKFARLAQAKALRQLLKNPVHVDKLVFSDTLKGTWQGADPNKSYAGLIPVIGGAEHPEFALTYYDLVGDIINHPTADKMEILPYTDKLHTLAVEFCNGRDLKQWFNDLVGQFPNGGTMKLYNFSTLNKKGGVWPNSSWGLD